MGNDKDTGISILDRDALARMVGELQEELAQERANSLAAQEIASRALVQRKEQEDAMKIFRAQWCDLVAATSAGRHLSVMRAQQRAALEWIAQARGYEIRFKALEPKLKDCESALANAIAERDDLLEVIADKRLPATSLPAAQER